MGKVERLQIWYNDEGILGLIKAVWVSAIYLTPLYHVLGRILGEERHEQLIRAPRLGYWPNIAAPQTFNEKLLHRKLYTDNDLYALAADKWRVREYVEEKVSDEILNDVYHVTDDPETIPFDELPDRFVIKANHGCGWNIFVDDKDDADYDEIKAQCADWLDTTYGEQKREYWYQEIEPKIIVEKFIEDDKHDVPRDYKFFVFNGRVEYIEVDFDRFTDHSRRFFDRDWTPQEFTLEFPLGPAADEPEQLDEMIEIAETIGEDFEAVRVDLYQPTDDEIIFGEITIAHGSGGERFDPIEYDREFGSYW
ncbi:ATP-grasp fold amidoligase family protein [Streptomyces sanglieri]